MNTASRPDLPARHPAAADIHSLVEPWQAGIASITERLYQDVYPDDYSGDNDPRDVVIEIRPKNERAAPLEILLYVDDPGRMDLNVDRWSRLEMLLGLRARSADAPKLDRVVAQLAAFEPLDAALEWIPIIAQAGMVVQAGVIGGRVRGTNVEVQLPGGRARQCGIRGVAIAKWLCAVGLARLEWFRYEPWC